MSNYDWGEIGLMVLFAVVFSVASIIIMLCFANYPGFDMVFATWRIFFVLYFSLLYAGVGIRRWINPY